MGNIKHSWALEDDCMNNACWYYCSSAYKHCGNPVMKENDMDISGCSPRIRHKEMLNQIVGNNKANKISIKQSR